jgi:hypothetical protein
VIKFASLPLSVFGARPADALGVCATEIARTDAFVGLYAATIDTSTNRNTARDQAVITLVRGDLERPAATAKHHIRFASLESTDGQIEYF